MSYLPVKAKTCPFCRAYPEVGFVQYHSPTDRDGAQAYVRCGRCFVNPHVSVIRDLGYWDNRLGWVTTRNREQAEAEALSTALRYWNTRAVPDPCHAHESAPASV